MAEDKILRPLIQEDAPFPGEAPTDGSQSSGSQQIFRPTETKEQEFPKRVIASELISSSIDSMSKKILGEYKFTSMGAIKIGQIKISDDGILGEDVDGRTTFALDPDTGDAIFRGRILAGSVIATEIQGEYIVAGTITADKLSASYIQVTGAAADVNAGSTTISGGKITAQTITSLGAVTAGSFAIGTNAWHVDTSGNMWWGSAASYATATIRISSAGSVDFTTGNFSGALSSASGTFTGTLSGGAVSGGTIDIGGADSTSFHVDSSGNVWLGAATYATAPFIISNIGEISTTTDAQIGGILYSNSIDMNNQSLTSCQAIVFTARNTSWTPGDREFGNEDNATNQRLRMKFQNNGTQWAVALNSICTPVNQSDYDPKYFEKYDLMTELDESRFKLKYPKTKDIQPEYRDRPLSHYPAMGDPDGTAWKQHMDAMWKRPWLPMKKMPNRMETMGQYPYPPVHSPLIGEGESTANLYQLLAHAYNKIMERIDLLESNNGK